MFVTVSLWFGAASLITIVLSVVLEKWRAPPQDSLAAYEPPEPPPPGGLIRSARREGRVP